MGRFITEDPTQDGINWYAYCGNNPIAKVDPDGKEGIFAFLAGWFNYEVSKGSSILSHQSVAPDVSYELANHAAVAVDSGVKSASSWLDALSEKLTVSKYLADTSQGVVSSKAVGAEIKPSLNIFKGSFNISAKLQFGGDVSIADPFGIAKVGLGTLFAEGTLGFKEGAFMAKLKVAAIQASGQAKESGLNIGLTGFAGWGGGIEIGSAIFGFEAAPAGIGGGLRLSFDPQSALQGAQK